MQYLMANLAKMPLEPITLDKSLALTQQCCRRMINTGDAISRCGGVVWPARRDTLVCSLACDPLLQQLDAAVLSQELADATPEDLVLFPDLIDDERIAQIALQDAVLEYVVGVCEHNLDLLTSVFPACQFVTGGCDDIAICAGLPQPQELDVSPVGAIVQVSTVS